MVSPNKTTISKTIVYKHYHIVCTFMVKRLTEIDVVAGKAERPGVDLYPPRYGCQIQKRDYI